MVAVLGPKDADIEYRSKLVIIERGTGYEREKHPCLGIIYQSLPLKRSARPSIDRLDCTLFSSLRDWASAHCRMYCSSDRRKRHRTFGREDVEDIK